MPKGRSGVGRPKKRWVDQIYSISICLRPEQIIFVLILDEDDDDTVTYVK